jgi:hypothetical protein
MEKRAASSQPQSQQSQQSQSWKKQKDFTPQDIMERLKGFVQMEDVDQLRTGMQVRYVSTDAASGRKTLKMGGILVYVDPKHRYLRVKSLLPGSIAPWSVQLATAEVYFRDREQEQREHAAMVAWAGTTENLERIRSVLGDGDALERNLRYVERNYRGELTTLVQSNRKLLQEYDHMAKNQRRYKEKIHRLKEQNQSLAAAAPAVQVAGGATSKTRRGAPPTQPTQPTQPAPTQPTQPRRLVRPVRVDVDSLRNMSLVDTSDF